MMWFLLSMDGCKVVSASFQYHKDTIWQENPFSGKIDDEYVWGRGALDDKSGVIAILEAVDYLLTQDFVPNRTIYFEFWP